LIARDDSRSRIIKVISIYPGIHLRELQRALGVSFNSVRYNTEKLAESGEINCEKTKGYSRFFPPGIREKDRVFYSFARNKTTFRILQELTKEPLISSKSLSEKTGFAKSTVSEHVHHLLNGNFVRMTLSNEGNFKVELLDREYVGRLVSAELKLRENDIIGNFVDLWDF